jgi:hypothetical protein
MAGSSWQAEATRSPVFAGSFSGKGGGRPVPRFRSAKTFSARAVINKVAISDR